MAELTEEWFHPSAEGLNVGVGYFDPLFVKVKRRNENDQFVCSVFYL